MGLTFEKDGDYLKVTDDTPKVDRATHIQLLAKRQLLLLEIEQSQRALLTRQEKLAAIDLKISEAERLGLDVPEAAQLDGALEVG